MNDRVVKAYVTSIDSNLRIAYLEKKKEIDGLIIIASVYKNVASGKFYCLAVIVDKGEYLFEQGREYSRYYTADEVVTKDVAQETIGLIMTQILARRRILTFMIGNRHLPSVLSVAFNNTLLIYYIKDSHLRISKLDKGQLVINLPAKEQVYLTDLLEQFNITVSRTPKELPGNGYLTT